MENSILIRDYVDRRGGLASFLVERRQSIDISSEKIGDYSRHLNRIGRRVTQEEIAEALGVSRVWYALLETSDVARPSLALLNRLAKVLALSAEEQRTLFELGIPELLSLASGACPEPQ
jgi:DNA-binding XRE family transcriptional regulator